MQTSAKEVQALANRLTDLECRNSRLEKTNLRFRYIALFAFSFALLGMFLGTGYLPNDLLEARGILLRSPDGRLRGSFIVSDDGGVRLTLVDKKKRARAGMWLEADGQCSLWGFDNLHQTDVESMGIGIGGSGKLITISSDAKIIERRRDKWTCGYKLTLRNDTNQDIDQAFYVTLIDEQGYVLGRQARMVRLGEATSHTLVGEIRLPPERAEQVAQVVLAMYEQP